MENFASDSTINQPVWNDPIRNDVYMFDTITPVKAPPSSLGKSTDKHYSPDSVMAGINSLERGLRYMPPSQSFQPHAIEDNNNFMEAKATTTPTRRRAKFPSTDDVSPLQSSCYHRGALKDKTTKQVRTPTGNNTVSFSRPVDNDDQQRKLCATLAVSDSGNSNIAEMSFQNNPQSAYKSSSYGAFEDQTTQADSWTTFNHRRSSSDTSDALSITGLSSHRRSSSDVSIVSNHDHHPIYSDPTASDQPTADNVVRRYSDAASHYLSLGQHSAAMKQYQNILAFSRDVIENSEGVQRKQLYHIVIADTLNNIGVVHELGGGYTYGLQACR